MAASGLLIKGISTGLARRAVNSGSYSLRHTNSRLTRIKSQIFSEVLSTLNQQQQQHQQKGFIPVHQASCISHLQYRQSPSSPSGVTLRRSVPLVLPPAGSVAPVRKRRLEGNEQPVEEKEDEEILQKRRRFSERISTRLAAARKNSEQPSSASRGVALQECSSPCPSSPCSSSTSSTVAMAQEEEVTFCEVSRYLESCCPRSRLTTTSSANVDNPAYFLRRSFQPIHIDLSIDSPETLSTCSSLSTCPAVSTTASATPPRLVIVRKRSLRESDSDTVANDSDEWFVRDENKNKQTLSPPPTLQRGWATSASSLANTPSPPVLQAAPSPTPPMLQRASDERLVLALCTSNNAPSTPTLGDSDETGGSETGSSMSALRPGRLRVRIKRMGRRLFCVPPEAPIAAPTSSQR
ncbi:hypothetical protein Aperf_G00000024521 [Anoplocephala perfoliata]